jgi:hypothetical protein
MNSLNYMAAEDEEGCDYPSPGGGLFCLRPLDHTNGHVWRHPSHKAEHEDARLQEEK